MNALARRNKENSIFDSLKLQLEDSLQLQHALASCKTTTPSSRGRIAKDLKRIANEDTDMKTETRKPKDANKTLQYTLSGIFFK